MLQTMQQKAEGEGFMSLQDIIDEAAECEKASCPIYIEGAAE